jgi:hypothetical protein
MTSANNWFAHLGEGIAQSLSADLLVVDRFRRAVAHGTAILEMRDEALAATGPPTVDPSRSFTHHQRPTARPTHESREAS